MVRSYSRRNRPVTSCLECTRRKQKCDRHSPCRRCVARGIASKCSYELPAESHEQISSKGDAHLAHSNMIQPSQPNTVHSPHSGLKDEDEPSKEYEGLSKRLGYWQQGENALSVVEKLLKDDTETRATVAPAEHHYNETKFWKRVKKLPSAATLHSLVQVFFTEANWYFAVLDRCYFDELLVIWTERQSTQGATHNLTPDLSHIPALLFQIIGLALQFLPPNHPCEKSLRQERGNKSLDAMSGEFSEQGDDLLDLLGRQNPSLTSVQADLMRSAWLKNEGRGAEAWDSLGLAVRQAQQLGLHLEPSVDSVEYPFSPDHLKARWLAEHRCRLWATLFVWESHMSLQLGRPRMIHLSDCTLADPIDCDFPLEPARTLLRVPGEGERPSSFTLQLVKYKIGCMIHEMMSAGLTNAPFQNPALVQSLHTRVFELLRSLPPAMQYENPDTSWDLVQPSLVKQRIQIRIVAFSFLAVLHRSHASTSAESRQNAAEAALIALDALQELFEKSEVHHYKIYTLVFFTIDMGMLLGALAIREYFPDATMRARIGRTLEQTINRLVVLKNRIPSARYGEVILRKCVQKYQKNATDTLNNDTRSDKYSETPLFAETEASIKRTPMRTPDVQTTPVILDDLPATFDLFDDILNERISTASWLENLDSLSNFDFELDNGGFP